MLQSESRRRRSFTILTASRASSLAEQLAPTSGSNLGLTRLDDDGIVVGKVGESDATTMDSSVLTEWSERVLSLAEERFERRLMQDVSGLRVELAQMESRLVKWSFLFWAGQVAAMAGLLAFMLRGIGW